MATTRQEAGAKKPLSFMDKLGPLVMVYRPTEASKSSDRKDNQPKLVIIGSWTNARDAHIAKYVTKYQSLYPDAQILLLRGSTSEIIRPDRIGPAMRPAVPIVRAVSSEPASSSSPRVLIHILSNGGSGSVANLYQQFAEANPDEPFPRHVTVFDSSPGVYSVGRAVAFLKTSLTPLQATIALPFLYAWAIAWYVFIFLGLLPESLGNWGKAHNNKDRTTEARRTYIYSPKDAIVDYKHIEAHAADAEKKGFQVTTERFDKSSHVAHMRHDESRYWGIVEKVWAGQK